MSGMGGDRVVTEMVRREQVNVRFDSTTRAALDAVAAEEDRPLSRIVRRALDEWLAAGGVVDGQWPVEPAGLERYVNVRFDAEALEGMDRRREAVGADRSMVIRFAVQAWLRRHRGGPGAQTGAEAVAESGDGFGVEPGANMAPALDVVPVGAGVLVGRRAG